MDTEETLRKTLENLLSKLELDYKKIEITEEEPNNFSINITSDNPSLLIGYRGENIQAFQQILKTLIWKKCNNEQFNITLDIDDYKKRQEENILNLAKRKVEFLRKTRRPQTLPPMSPYFRRKIHMMCMGPGFDDIETVSEGDGEDRFITLKLKS